MKDKKTHINTNIIDLKKKRIEKTVRDDADKDCREALSELIQRFQDDTLTGK